MIPTITILDDGPLQIRGDFELVDDSGTLFRRRKICSLCRCGLTQRAPFCDASHVEGNFSSCPRAPARTPDMPS